MNFPKGIRFLDKCVKETFNYGLRNAEGETLKLPADVKRAGGKYWVRSYEEIKLHKVATTQTVLSKQSTVEEVRAYRKEYGYTCLKHALGLNDGAGSNFSLISDLDSFLKYGEHEAWLKAYQLLEKINESLYAILLERWGVRIVPNERIGGENITNSLGINLYFSEPIAIRLITNVWLCGGNAPYVYWLGYEKAVDKFTAQYALKQVESVVKHADLSVMQKLEFLTNKEFMQQVNELCNVIDILTEHERIVENL